MTGKKMSDQALLDALLRSDFNLFLDRCFRALNPGKAFCGRNRGFSPRTR